MYAITDDCTLRQCLSERDQLRRHVDSLNAIISSVAAVPDLEDVDTDSLKDGLHSLADALRDRESALAEYEDPTPDYLTYEAAVAMGARAA